jgi:hypothetical protein
MSLFAVDYLLPKIVTAQRRRAPTFILPATAGRIQEGIERFERLKRLERRAQRDREGD